MTEYTVSKTIYMRCYVGVWIRVKDKSEGPLGSLLLVVSIHRCSVKLIRVGDIEERT